MDSITFDTICASATMARGKDDTAVQRSASLAERHVLAIVWQHIQEILASGMVEDSIRALSALLPAPASLSSSELPVLAKLHLSSAHNLMATLRLLAPSAFAGGAAHPDLSALDDADGSLLAMASTLIELQLFHLTRAATLTAHSRVRLQLQRSAAVRRASAASCSSNSSSAGESGGNNSIQFHMYELTD